MVTSDLRLLLLIPLCSFLIMPPTLAQGYIWGTAGRDGLPGRPGQRGTSGQDGVIRESALPQVLDRSGQAGEDGEDGRPGEHASFCDQPRGVTQNLVGAPGGNGGAGGTGGNGGHGGNVQIYVSDLAVLQNLTLNLQGGSGGRGGRGALGGLGCPTSQSTWMVYHCRWTLYKRPITLPESAWVEDKRQLQRCTGDAGLDRYSYRPDPVIARAQDNVEYTWQYNGVARRSQFFARSGANGAPGDPGRDGQPGRTGQVSIILGDRIPSEKLQDEQRFSQQNQQPISLTRNFWDPQVGLLGRLGSGSRVSDQYLQLRTVQAIVVPEWRTNQDFSSLGDPAFRVELDEQGELQVEVPGTLDYQLESQGQTTRLVVSGGIHPDRLGGFRFAGFDRFRDARNFALIDETHLLADLQACTITIEVSDGKSTEQFRYRLTAQEPAPSGIVRTANLYKVQLPESPLFTAGTKLTYRIQIEQITRSGQAYPSGMTLEQVVDRITPNPSLEYF